LPLCSTDAPPVHPARIEGTPSLASSLTLAALLMLALPAASSGQQAGEISRTGKPTVDNTLEAGEAEAVEPRRRLVHWNEYEGPFFTIRVGGGVLVDYVGYSQDDASQQQFDLTPEFKLRDARFLLKGRIKFKRPVTWSAGIMWDGTSQSWLIRETGIMVAVPELWGHIFLDAPRKEFSLNKVMAGYAGWTMERATIGDATIPILADGVKWLGYAPKLGLVWNLGLYGDLLSEGQSFSTYHHQVAGRLAWLPVLSENTVLHIGMSARYGQTHDDVLRLRSRPEAYPAPYFVDTEEFAAKSTKMLATEIYYRPGSLLLGSEYFVQKAEAPESGNPWFHGGDVVASWLITGEKRVYNTRGGFFHQISPTRTVFEGGPGAWELVARFSYIDLDGGTIRGGRFWRFTPMVNWHLGPCTARTCLRVRFSQSVRPRRRHPVLPVPTSTPALRKHWADAVTGAANRSVRFIAVPPVLSFVLYRGNGGWELRGMGDGPSLAAPNQSRDSHYPVPKIVPDTQPTATPRPISGLRARA
jgi:phosphate-selective porin OprO/OprP